MTVFAHTFTLHCTLTTLTLLELSTENMSSFAHVTTAAKATVGPTNLIDTGDDASLCRAVF